MSAPEITAALARLLSNPCVRGNANAIYAHWINDNTGPEVQRHANEEWGRTVAEAITPFLSALLDAREALAQRLETAEMHERQFMWLGHGHDALYGDDGEMQCSRCRPCYDYKRTPIEQVREHFERVQMSRISKELASANRQADRLGRLTDEMADLVGQPRAERKHDAPPSADAREAQPPHEGAKQMKSACDELCRRCLHPSSWHRHDDQACLSTHPQPCAPRGCSTPHNPTHDAPFRCIGYDCMADGFVGGTPKTRCGCPNFERNCDDSRRSDR